MAKMRASKKLFRQWLSGEDWQSHQDEIIGGGLTSIAPLFSMLPQQPLLMHRASRALGQTIGEIYRKNPDAAKNIVRRFMWHMNEESGNIGWGIPEAFAETLVASPELAKIYANILISYIMDLGHDDNYCDNDLLRRSCYYAVGRLAQADPALAAKARLWLVKGLADRDSICRGMAAWALAQLPPDFMDAPPLRILAQSKNEDVCEIYDQDKLREATVSALAQTALEHLV